ncbi:MAG: glycerol-3-phosphate 1-O-acyltransferase PlsY [Pseudomonadota bacterium]
MLELIAKVVIAYLVGSISGSLLLGRLKGIDIREHGSGNAGGTNAMRTLGVAFAIGVIIIDIGKGWLAGAVIGPYNAGDARDIFLCGAAAVIGHCYPIYHGFRGGKGAATLVGVFAAVHWPMILPVFLAWLVVVVVTGFVGLATITAGFAALVYTLVTGQPAMEGAVWFFGAMAVFVLYTHRANISRMLAGNENRASRLWLFKPRTR